MDKLINFYYEVKVTKTSKPLGNTNSSYRIFDEQRLVFASIGDVNKWVEETYGNCKRVKMYRDLPNGDSQQVGRVYCFKNADWSHTPIEQWWQQDWVTVNQIKSTPVLK